MDLFGISRAQLALYAFTIVVVVALGTAVADAMVETDTERLDEVARVLGRSDPDARIDGLLAWADPSREPVFVTAHRSHVRVDDAADLSPVLHDALDRLAEGDVEILQSDASVRGETGTVSVGTRVDGERFDVTLTLRREGQGWLLAGVRAY
jgi:hypothetical protein